MGEKTEPEIPEAFIHMGTGWSQVSLPVIISVTGVIDQADMHTRVTGLITCSQLSAKVLEQKNKFTSCPSFFFSNTFLLVASSFRFQSNFVAYEHPIYTSKPFKRHHHVIRVTDKAAKFLFFLRKLLR